MTINSQKLDAAYKGFKTVYTEQFDATEGHASKIAMTVQSNSSEEHYAWLGMFPELREWIGERHIKQLEAHGFTIKNKKFETTIEVERDDISDDKFGLYKPMFAEAGRAAKKHPDSLIFKLLSDGFDTTCYDGNNFFDTDHPTKIDGKEVSVSNMKEGGGAAWFLLDTSRAIKPIIWQEREGYELQTVTNHDDHHVFMHDKYLYGVRARVNAGLGLWQMAYASSDILSPETYKAARAAMMGFRATTGQKLGIKPNVLVVPSELEGDALQLIKAQTINNNCNIWYDSAELIVTTDLEG